MSFAPVPAIGYVLGHEPIQPGVVYIVGPEPCLLCSVTLLSFELEYYICMVQNLMFYFYDVC